MCLVCGIPSARNASVLDLSWEPACPTMLRPSPHAYVEASAAAARETELLAKGVRPDTLLQLVLGSARLRPLEQGPKRTVTSPLRPPAYCKWLEEAMGVIGGGSQPRRALCRLDRKLTTPRYSRLDARSQVDAQ